MQIGFTRIQVHTRRPPYLTRRRERALSAVPRTACADLHLHVARAALRLAELPGRLGEHHRRRARLGHGFGPLDMNEDARRPGAVQWGLAQPRHVVCWSSAGRETTTGTAGYPYATLSSFIIHQVYIYSTSVLLLLLY